MKSRIVCNLPPAVALLVPSLLAADVPAGPPRVSPMATVSQVVGVSEVSIVYSRPGVRERVIWDELVPLSEVWRTGANEATTFTTTDDAKIDGEPLAAGSYGLFTIPGDSEWTVIFNKVAEQWGAFNYDAAQDALRIQVKPRAAEFKERFEIGFSDVGADSTTVSMRWEKLEIPFDVQFDVQRAAVARARAFVANAAPQDGRMIWSWANYCYQNNVNTGEALQWATNLAEDDPMYWTHALAARLKAVNGDKAGAVASAKLALERVAAEGDQPGVTPDSETLKGEILGWESGG